MLIDGCNNSCYSLLFTKEPQQKFKISHKSYNNIPRFGDKDRGLFLADEGRGLLVGLGDTLRCLADVGRNDGDEGDDDPLEGEIAALASSIDCIFWADEGLESTILRYSRVMLSQMDQC